MLYFEKLDEFLNGHIQNISLINPPRLPFATCACMFRKLWAPPLSVVFIDLHNQI